MSSPRRHSWSATWADVRRSFVEFLAIPAATVLFFVALAVGTFLLDRHPVGWFGPAREFLHAHLVNDKAEALLGTIAGGLITITSISFSLLLLAVQQSAAALTAQVLDQFLQRRVNQLYFGVGVGVSLFALVTLATNSTRVTPVLGASMALLLTVVALVVLVLMLYSTLNQMRPIRIVGAIHGLTLAARERQRELVRRTARAPAFEPAPVRLPVRAADNGYVADVALDVLGDALARLGGRGEVVLQVAIGTHVTFDQTFAEVRAADRADADRLVTAAARAVRLERQRDARQDASYGVDQLATIGWTSISSAKSNPAPGIACVWHLRDLLVRWTVTGWGAAEQASVPVVYPDRVLDQVVDALESLGVAASESLQHQSAAAVLCSFAVVLDQVTDAEAARVERAARVLLTTLGDLPLTAELDDAMRQLAGSLDARGLAAAREVREARERMAALLGTLQSRGTRASAANDR